jgi:hypothetical protein
MNGNNAALNSRVYLFNPSQSAGNVTVRVFTLPLAGGLAQELTGTPLHLGTLGAKSALNVKLAEDILSPLGITTPYFTDGGNLTLEFTIEAADVLGAAQVFSSGFAFGTSPLQEILSTSSGSPTVLIANFTNGNNTALNSRMYLWNPSESAGEVTVRVFTLPLSGGLAQELTGTPLNLGILGARSALNVKLAEDILTPLGITTPYTIDGGNLTVELTIQAADVVGAAQVFSSDFAFGTYPLQETIVQVQECQVTLPDPNLKAAVREALGLSEGTAITCEQAESLVELTANNRGIVSLSGLEFFSNLTSLELEFQSIRDITPIEGLTQLTFLLLGGNSISDITPLAGLTELTRLDLGSNFISDISPLIANPGIGPGDTVDVHANALDTGDCADLQTLIDRGASVSHDVLCSCQASPITLILLQPQHFQCGNVSINGVVTVPDATIVNIAWNWEDGTETESFFPASHRYLQNGTYTVQVTPQSTSCATATETTTFEITNAEGPSCGSFGATTE